MPPRCSAGVFEEESRTGSKDNPEGTTVLTVELVVLLDVVYAVVDGIRRFRFLYRAVFVPGVVDEAIAKFGCSTTAVFPAELLQVIVHLPVGKHFRTENDQVHVGIDVRLLIIYRFCWTFEEPVSSIHMLFPEWFLAERPKGRYHFCSSTQDRTVADKFVVNFLFTAYGRNLDVAYAKPPEGDHANVVVAFSLEFEE